jgi:MFS family permease
MMSLRGLGRLPALEHRNYRLFFAGQGISLVGTWMTSVAQAWLVLQLTGNPFDLGLVGAAQFLPVLVLGLFGGLIADALPKRQTMYVTQIVAMAVSGLLFVLAATHTVQLWHVFVLAVVMGVRNSIDMPTRQAFAVEMVGHEDISNAVALNSAMFNGARIVGPAVAGIAIGAFGVALAFLIDAISFLAVLVGLYLMDEEALRPAPRMAQSRSIGSVIENLAEGLSYVRRTGIVLLAMTLIGVVGTAGINFNVVIPPLAETTLRVGATGYGFLMASSGVGSLLAALLIAFRGTNPARMLVGAFVLGAGELVMGVSGSYVADLGLMFLLGMGAISMMATANTTIQLAVPDALRGRVMSVYTTVFAGTAPIGGLATGAIAANFGAGAAIFAGGAVSVVATLGAAAWYRRLRGTGRVPAGLRSGHVAARSVSGAREVGTVPEGEGADEPVLAAHATSRRSPNPARAVGGVRR